MKEYIFQIDNVQEGNMIQVFNAPTGLEVKNILAIINKTTGKPVHSPIANAIASVSYGQVTTDRMFIALKPGHPAIAGNLLIKAYTNEDADIDDKVEYIYECISREHVVDDDELREYLGIPVELDESESE